MTITLNEEKNIISIATTLLEESLEIITLYVTKNCGEIFVLDFPTDSIVIEVTPVMLGQQETDKFEEGVYSFQLEVATDENDILIEQQCYFLETSLYCDILPTLLNINDPNCFKKAILFNYLTLGNYCSSCDCTSLCTIYETLKAQKSCCDEQNNASCKCR